MADNRVAVTLLVLFLVHSSAWTTTRNLPKKAKAICAVTVDIQHDTKEYVNIAADKTLLQDIDTDTSATVTAAAAQSNKNVSSSSDYYLFSLQWTPDDCISKPVRDLWKWKDNTLGDGRDFFVPKPKTITALQEICLNNGNFDECSIISNCARFEILVCRRNSSSSSANSNSNPIQELSRIFTTETILWQESTSRGSGSWQSLLTQKMDWPELVLLNDKERNEILSKSEIQMKIDDQSNELERYWTQINGIEDILIHLSLVAAGIASRPNRPNRETLFQPFSSRDAHILLQLKRTKEVAIGSTTNKILEFALRAGKAARNIDLVPEIERLRSYSQYSSETPKSLSREIAQTAVDKAILPLVRECLETVQAQEASHAIQQLRMEAETLASNPSELKLIKSLLHQPTIDLRKGLQIDQDALLKYIQKELRHR